MLLILRSSLGLATFTAVLAAQAQGPLFTQQEVVANALHSYSLAGVGDLNGSGSADVVIGSPGDLGVAFVPYGGSVMVVDGNGTILRYHYGFQGDRLGNAVIGLGDATGDGVPDFAVGAIQGDAVTGGRKNGYVAFYDGASTANNAAAVISAGITPTSSALNPDSFGRHLQAIGDWNGDGVSEVLLAAPQGHNPPVYQAQGYVRIHDPVAVMAGNLTPLVSISGFAPASRFGAMSCGLPDLDGDSIPEFAVASTNESTALTTLGVVRVFSGGSGALLRVVEGDSDSFGTSMVAVHDINGDGVDDLAVGVPGTPGPFGSTLFRGRVIMISGLWIATGAGTQVLATYKAVDVLADYWPVNWDQFGYAMSNMGDLDDDGYDDLAVGAPAGPSWDPDTDAQWPQGYTLSGCGYVRLISSKNGGLLKVVRGEAEGDQFGRTVANVGDLDQDGISDVGIGAPFKDLGQPAQGRSYFYSGDYGLGYRYGATAPNSVGAGAIMRAEGSLSVACNNFRLVSTGLPPGNVGLFFYGGAAMTPPLPFYDGFLNIDSGGFGVHRLPGVSTGAGEVTYQVDLTMPPSAQGLITPGSRWFFQFWFRDTGFGQNGVNLSDGLSVGFVN